jgi:hypothetical protein
MKCPSIILLSLLLLVSLKPLPLGPKVFAMTNTKCNSHSYTNLFFAIGCVGSKKISTSKGSSVFKTKQSHEAHKRHNFMGTSQMYTLGTILQWIFLGDSHNSQPTNKEKRR